MENVIQSQNIEIIHFHFRKMNAIANSTIDRRLIWKYYIYRRTILLKLINACNKICYELK